MKEICSSSRDHIAHEKDLEAVAILNLWAWYVMTCFLVTKELPWISVLRQNSV